MGLLYKIIKRKTLVKGSLCIYLELEVILQKWNYNFVGINISFSGCFRFFCFPSLLPCDDLRDTTDLWGIRLLKHSLQMVSCPKFSKIILSLNVNARMSVHDRGFSCLLAFSSHTHNWCYTEDRLALTNVLKIVHKQQTFHRFQIHFLPKWSYMELTKCIHVDLGGLEVTCSPRDPRFAGSNPAFRT